jgi:enoyl-CoA hydratase/carnithine racemase
MTCRPVEADELLRSGFVQRLVPVSEFEAAVDLCVDQLLAVPPGPLAMTRSMTSAIGRTAPAMVAGWGDADHQRWAFTEEEFQTAVRAYVDRGGRPISRPVSGSGGS